MKWNNKVLAIIFFVLFGIWILKNFVSQPKTRSFRTNLVQIDTSIVDKFVIYPKGIDSSFIEVVKNNGRWEVSNGSIKVPAESNRVNSILSQLANVPTKQLMSKSSEKHADYEVTNEKGKVVGIYSKGQLMEKVIFGRFNFNQATRSGVSYARLESEDDVYALDGFMSMSFNTNFNSFRNNKILSLAAAEIKSINYNGMSISPIEGGAWQAGSVVIDSSSMQDYIAGLSAVTGNDFEDNFSDLSNPTKQLNIIADNRIGAIEVNCFESGNNFIIKSSENDAFFSSDSSGIYQKLFGELELLIASE